MENMENQVAVHQSATEFTVGSVLSKTWSTLMKNPILFVGLTLMGLVPATIITIVLLMLMASSGSGSAIFIAVIVLIITGALTLVFQAAVCYGVFLVLRNEKTSFGHILARSLSSVITLVLLAIAIGIATGVGIMLFVIPGLIIMTMVAVAVPVCVVEKKGVFASINRSTELSKGYRLKIFALVLIVGIVIWLINNVVSSLVVSIVPSSVIAMIIVMIIVAIPQTYSNVMASIMYYDLRNVKEGVSVDSLAQVFD